MEAKELATYTPYKIDKVFNGTVEHGCCLCQAKITERKMKVLTRGADGNNKQFFFCVKCFPTGLAHFCNGGRIDRSRPY